MVWFVAGLWLVAAKENKQGNGDGVSCLLADSRRSTELSVE
jgi:hypothetical protein